MNKRKVRIISRLDVKAPNVVKGIQMEGLKKLGDPNDFAREYYEQNIDEILYIDIVASLFERNSLIEIVNKTTQNVFVPITVGGGIRSIEDAKQLLRAGADKIAINTAAIKNPKLISDLANAFGSQCVVVSIHAKKSSNNNWEAYYDCGREHTGLSVLEWVKQAEQLGAGEILITSIDQDGTQAGCDLTLIKSITQTVKVPVIAAGGVGTLDHVVEVINECHPDAIAIGSALHYKTLSISSIREKLLSANIPIRNI